MGLEGSPAGPTHLGQGSSRGEQTAALGVELQLRDRCPFPSQWPLSSISLWNLVGRGQEPPGQGTRLGAGTKVWYPNQKPICYRLIHVSIYSKEKFLSGLNIQKSYLVLKSWWYSLKDTIKLTFSESVPHSILLRSLCFLVLSTTGCAVSLNDNHCLWNINYVSVPA